MLFYCANLKAIRYESTSLNRIVDDKLHHIIVACFLERLQLGKDTITWCDLLPDSFILLCNGSLRVKLGGLIGLCI